jgi:hypothetical protein
MKKIVTILIIFFITSCESQKVEYEVTSQQIYKEFQDNEVAALSKYKGKKIRVTGELLNFTHSIGNDYCFIGSHGDFLGEVQYKMSEDFSKNAGNYSKGQIITLEGIVDSKSFTGIIQIH